VNRHDQGFGDVCIIPHSHADAHVAAFSDSLDGITCSSPDLIQQTVFDQVGLGCPLFTSKWPYPKHKFQCHFSIFWSDVDALT